MLFAALPYTVAQPARCFFLGVLPCLRRLVVFAPQTTRHLLKWPKKKKRRGEGKTTVEMKNKIETTKDKHKICAASYANGWRSTICTTNKKYLINILVCEQNITNTSYAYAIFFIIYGWLLERASIFCGHLRPKISNTNSTHKMFLLSSTSNERGRIDKTRHRRNMFNVAFFCSECPNLRIQKMDILPRNGGIPHRL